MIAIVDYEMGNLRSVQKAVEHEGGAAVVTADEDMLQAARGLILPGVGAFGDAMRSLQARQLVDPIKRQVEAGKPLLGICLGMQLLFEESDEMGPNQGLGVFRGRVLRFPGTPAGSAPAASPPAQRAHRVPHIGWNQVHHCQNSPLLTGIPDSSYAYFVHSYYVVPEDEAIVLATTDYGLTYASIVGRGNIYGAQFHPEKSQEVGLQLLRNFVKIANRR